ncbi:hypothetical protein PHLGIDRAFT_119388 [Phlebiopsis gigantea 11061_1 CR5-6]|uniref:Cytochrome P450 n=1 Tax=Phlebiopsis gigantea (strain 11061_1 CR5-6) TaxID=745531 RepID=A0A0C3S986_PHLG1|nr:hypothetical protein PHLGIDRAFT_119388 [Phlebiopsis gigantea 11061_1 CR5-6]
MNTVALVLLSTLALFVVKRLFGYRAALRSVQGHPGSRNIITPFGIFGFLVPEGLPGGICEGGLRSWYTKHRDFERYGVDIISTISVFPQPEVVLQDITTSRARFPKPVIQYEVLAFFGPNIVASEHEQWKRFRKVSAPAFSERNNRLVWDETVKIMIDLFDNVWGEQKQIVVNHAVDVTLPIALFVIGVAGFGRRISWKDDLVVPPNHKMAFKDALHVVSLDVFYKIAVPGWIMKHFPTQRMKKVCIAFEELEQYMREMIHARRTAEKKEERYDLFSSLLEASEDELDGTGSVKLTDQELLGNIFIFLLAGHETTAHTLCFAFGLLALYPEKQENLYKHIKSIIPDGRIPTYDEMNLFTESMAVFYETLRMFPPAHNVPKKAAEDTALHTQDADGNKIIVPVPQGTGIILHLPGLHYNPRYWDDPYAFKPERFLGDWPRDAFLPFSSGARACLGRRFFETEGIAILTMLVSRYKIAVKEEPQFAGETLEQRQARILRAKAGLTLTPIRMPLVFTRRDA